MLKNCHYLEFSPVLSSYPDDDMPIQSKGGYNVDFDNLDAIDPFQGSNKMILSPARPAVESPAPHQTEPTLIKPEEIPDAPPKIESALDETLPFIQSVENSLADASVNVSSTESSVVTVMKMEEPDSYTATPDEKQGALNDEGKASGSFVEDAPLPAKGAYTLDFDNLDDINPFQTGGSKILNSPVIGRKVSDNDPPAEEMHTEENKPTNVVEMPQVVQKAPVQPQMKPVVAVAPISANATEPPATESQPFDAPAKGGAVKLEFNFDDGSEVKQKPPPKKFGNRPSGVKAKAGKLPSDVKAPREAPVKPDTSDVADVPAPKGSYSFDIDKFDDPNFNPFGTKSGIHNSPLSSKKSAPVLNEASSLDLRDKPVKEDVLPTWCVNLVIGAHQKWIYSWYLTCP